MTLIPIRGDGWGEGNREMLEAKPTALKIARGPHESSDSSFDPGFGRPPGGRTQNLSECLGGPSGQWLPYWYLVV